MAIESIFDVARTLQMFFERIGQAPWSIADQGGSWHLVDSVGKLMGIDFGPSTVPIHESAEDFVRALNYVPVLRRVKVEHEAQPPSDFCVVAEGRIPEQQVAAMLTSMLHSAGVLGKSAVVEVSGELAPSILQYDNHGIIPICISGAMDYVPNIKLKERKRYDH